MKWTVGVITAPREKGYYLDQALRSLARAGWGEPTVFAEPGSVVPEFNGHVVRRPKAYGDWTNWATGFYELLLSHPDTDYFLMVEDDAVVCAGAKRYIEHALPLIGPFGSLSLYTPSLYKHKNFAPVFHNELRERKTWSTVTVVMSRAKAIDFFSDANVQRHRFEDIFGEDERFWCCPKTDPKNSIKDAVIVAESMVPHAKLINPEHGKKGLLDLEEDEINPLEMGFGILAPKFAEAFVDQITNPKILKGIVVKQRKRRGFGGEPGVN